MRSARAGRHPNKAQTPPRRVATASGGQSDSADAQAALRHAVHHCARGECDTGQEVSVWATARGEKRRSRAGWKWRHALAPAGIQPKA